MIDAQRTSTLVKRLFPDTGGVTRTGSLAGSRLRTALLVTAGVAFLALLAQLRVYVGPVPVTGQTLGVLLLGAAYGARLGAFTTGAYLLLGVAGAPLFTGGQGGFAYLLGPTGGYLIGFVAAAYLLGALAERGFDRSPLRAAVAMGAASVVIYAFGLSWLKVSLGLGWTGAIAAGMLPFLIGDLIKLASAATLLPGAWWLLGRGER